MRRTNAVLAVLCVLAGSPAAAHAAAGFALPTLIDGGHAYCPELDGGTLAWATYQPGARGRAVSLLAPPGPVVDRVATLGAAGPRDVTPIGPADGMAHPCVGLAAAGTHSLAAAAVVPSPQGLFPLAHFAAPVWLAAPGQPPRELTPDGGYPAIALAPDGSGVVAWVQSEASALGPTTFTVWAARLAPGGQAGAPQQLSPPAGAITSPSPGGVPQYLEPPVAIAGPGGSLAVAWALPTSDDSEQIVQVSTAPPAGAFAASQTLFTSTVDPGVSEAVMLALSGAPGAPALLAWTGAHPDSTQANGLGLSDDFAVQTEPGGPFVPISAPFTSPAVARTDTGTVLGSVVDPDGQGTVLVGTPYGLTGGLWALRGAVGEPFGLRQMLTGGNAHSPSMAVAPDGTVAVAWVQQGVGPDEGLTDQVRLTTAPPGRPFGPPVSLTGLAESVVWVTVGFDDRSVLQLAWTVGEGFNLDGDDELGLGALYATRARPGSADPLRAPGPRIAVALLNHGIAGGPLVVRVRVDRPCLVELEGLAPTQPGAPVETIGRRFLRAGAAVLELNTSGFLAARRVRLVAYASTSTGASSAVGHTFTLPATRRAAAPR